MNILSELVFKTFAAYNNKHKKNHDNIISDCVISYRYSCVDDSLRHIHTPSVGCNQNVDVRTDKGLKV